MKEPGSLPALSLYTTGKEVLVRGSETVISVLGMTSIVSSLSHWFGVVFQVLETIIFLIGNRLPTPSQIILKTEDDEEKSVASVSAVLFFVLALQTGLTGMEGEKRFQQVLTNRDVEFLSYLITIFQICKNLCLLLTAVLHFIHSMVQPVLMSLSASRSSNRASHIRVYLVHQSKFSTQKI